MPLIEEIQQLFGTKNLYDVINVDKSATNEQIKKAYRKASLKIHPDRVNEDEKDKATKRFQALAQVHFVLSDSERRRLYDEHGVISNDDNIESEADWANYWRLLFPKVSEHDIQAFLDSYVGSEEEEQDLVKIYNRFEGDLDKISETHMSYDEERTTGQLRSLIADGKIVDYPMFSKESSSRKAKRSRRANKEAKQADKLRSDLRGKSGPSVDNMNDLAALIKKRSQGSFDNMIASLEAKYSTESKGTKRKRSNR